MDCGALDRSLLHADLERLLDYCIRLAGKNDLPRLSDFRPSALPELMACIFAADRIENGADYRYRSFGARLPEFFGEDLRGKRLSESSDPGFRENVLRGCESVLCGRAPVLRRQMLSWPDGGSFRLDVLSIPFADDAGNPTIVLGAAVCSVPAENLVLYRGKGMAQVLSLDTDQSQA